MGALLEIHVTKVTLMWPKPQMAIVNVPTKAVSEVKDLVAFDAFVRAHALMPRLDMLLEIRFLRKTAFACSTFPVLNLIVNDSLVLLRRRYLSEQSSTDFTRYSRWLSAPLPYISI